MQVARWDEVDVRKSGNNNPSMWKRSDRPIAAYLQKLPEMLGQKNLKGQQLGQHHALHFRHLELGAGVGTRTDLTWRLTSDQEFKSMSYSDSRAVPVLVL